MISLDIALIHHKFMAELLDLLSLRQYFIFHKMSAWFCYALICSGLIIRVFLDSCHYVPLHYNVITWGSWLFRSPESGLFVQLFHHQRKYQSLCYWPFVKGIHWWPVDPPSQRASNMVTFSMSWCHHDLWELLQGSHMLIHMITPQPAKKSWRKWVKSRMTKPK